MMWSVMSMLISYADDDYGVEISDDAAFICSVIEVSIKTMFQLVIKASVRSGHEEVICRYCKNFEKKISFPTCILGTLHRSESLNTELVYWSAFERMVRPLSKEVF
eukprot:7947435-Ditylum_brightwellii.AAC.1